ncbi:MAG: agglutinin biogenesis protein MshP [Betaproteobacteria bacterium]|nr:agglutinin biogenesis protein MshP [Betaproteobacteria bacterium]
MSSLSFPRRERGFLIIAAVFLLVVLAGLVAYLSTVSTTSQAASAADFQSARAYQAARAGVEWGVYQILRVPGGTCSSGTPFVSCCDAGSVTKNLTFGSTLSSFTATVTCTSVSTTEGAATVKVYRIQSNGCNDPTGGACPNTATTSATYAEREVILTVTN